MKRILTAVVLIPLVVLLLLKGPFWLLTIVAAGVSMLACWEYLALAHATGAGTPRILTIVAIGALFLTAFRLPEMLLPVFVACALILFVVASFRSPLNRVLLDTSASVFGLVYTALTLTTLLFLSQQEEGRSLLVFLFFAVWSGDIAALYIGRRFGKRKLAPKLSPNKTWEGSAASIVGSMIIAGLLLLLAAQLEAHGITLLMYAGSSLYWLMLAALLNVAAQLGDLVESALKRGGGVKDSGTLLPGHGGILDRIDALLLAAPVLWFIELIQQSF